MVLSMEVAGTDFFTFRAAEGLRPVADWMPRLVPLTVPKTNVCDQAESKNGDDEGRNVTFLDYAKLLVPGKVTAGTTIPQGAMTVQIEPRKLIGKIDIKQVSVGVTSFGTIDLDRKSKSEWSQDIHWVRAIRLSEDCHTYNVQLKFQPSYSTKLILQAVRPIEPGQELQLWFSEDILALLQVVFLSPANIQGKNKYICLKCSAFYESPNPLKLHITLACGKIPILALWERLATMRGDVSPNRNVVSKEKDFEFKLTPNPQSIKQRTALDLSVSGHSSTATFQPNALHHQSAFRPFNRNKPQIVEINGNGATPTFRHPGTVRQDSPGVWTDVVQVHRNLMHPHDLTNVQNIYGDDAQIESLVSSLGKAKQGHICLYCGKCYSRKYGLKIHIRTHTGYKPLRCKFCDRPFGDPSNLNKHVRLHAEGNTPYKCELCGKILVRRRDLERHLKSRHLVEMHPGQNILPDSSSEDISSTLKDSSVTIPEENVDSDSNLIDANVNEIKIEEDPDVTIIEVDDDDHYVGKRVD